MAKNIVEAGDNSVHAVMAAASLAAKDTCPDASFVIQKMAAFPELASRMKTFIKSPSNRRFFIFFNLQEI